MYNIQIRRPKAEDINELHEFFRTVITDTFAREGLAELADDIEHEIQVKKGYIKRDLESNGEDRYFLLALSNDKIVGTIEYGLANDLISKGSNGVLSHVMEVGTVFVHPDYQRQGIGNLLLNAIYITLQSRGIEEFCIDSGYTNAQKIWIKKFGEPDYLMKDYWAIGYSHMIWRVYLKNTAIQYVV